MKKNLAYLLGAFLAIASANPARAMSEREAIKYLGSLGSANPGLFVLSSLSGVAVGFALAHKAVNLSDQAARIVNHKMELSKDQTVLKKFAAIAINAGINITSVLALLAAEGALCTALLTKDNLDKYELLSSGLSFAALAFRINLPMIALFNSLGYAIKNHDTTDKAK